MLTHHANHDSPDDQLAKQVRREAEARGLSMSAFNARTLSDALKRREPTEQPPSTLITARGVHPCSGVDLDGSRMLEVQEDKGRFKRGYR